MASRRLDAEAPVRHMSGYKRQTGDMLLAALMTNP